MFEWNYLGKGLNFLSKCKDDLRHKGLLSWYKHGKRIAKKKLRRDGVITCNTWNGKRPF